MIDPATGALILQGVSLVGNLGANYFGRNDARDAMRKAEEENKKRIAQANLSRAFGGNPGVDLVQPKLKQGAGTSLLRAIGQGAGIGSQAMGIYSGLKDASQMRDLRNTQMQTASIQNDAAQMALDTQIGGQKFSLGDMGRQAERARMMDTVKNGPTLGNLKPPTSLAGGFKEEIPELFNPLNAAQAGGFSAANQAASLVDTNAIRKAEQDALDAALRQAQIGSANRANQPKPPAPAAGMTPKQAIEARGDLIKAIGDGFDASIAGNPTMSWAEFSAQPAVSSHLISATPVEVGQLQSLYITKQESRLAGIRDAEGEALTTHLGGRIKQDKDFTLIPGVVFGYGSMAEGYNANDGQGDLAIITGIVRMKDPTATVREGDIDTEEKALTVLENYGVMIGGEKIWGEGGRMLQPARDRFLALGQDLYRNTEKQVAYKMPMYKKFGVSMMPPGADLGKVDAYLEPYKLRPLEEFSAPILIRDNLQGAGQGGDTDPSAAIDIQNKRSLLGGLEEALNIGENQRNSNAETGMYQWQYD